MTLKKNAKMTLKTHKMHLNYINYNLKIGKKIISMILLLQYLLLV